MKTRRNITIDPSILARANELMNLRCFSDFSGFIEQLIREEWDRRHGPAQFPIVTPVESGATAAAAVVAPKSGGPPKT